MDITGTPNNDSLTGTANDDTLNGLGGRDSLFGKAGDDILNGGEGDDRLYGEEGNDTLNGEEGNDDLYPGDGADQIDGGDGTDELILDYRESTAAATVTYTSETGTTGDGKTFKNIEDITFYGSEENDEVDASTISTFGYFEGNGGNDTIKGGSSNDTIYGEEGNDVISGNGGDDNLYGGEGDDILNGGEGNDDLRPGSGADEIDGGAGDRDTLVLDYRESTAAATVTYTSETGTTGDGKTFKNIEDITFYGSEVNDEVDASAISTFGYFEGNGGNDTIKGGSSNDTIYGEEGNDVISGNGGDDNLYGGEGDDILNGGEGNDDLRPGSGADEIDGGAGDRDTLVLDYSESAEVATVTYTSADGTTSDGKTFTGIERITFDGSSGNDVVDISFVNGSSSNSLEGKDGDDIIKGSNISGDFIYGQAGNDTLEGNGGNDWLYGGEGNDVLRGGEGNDRLFTGNGVDEVDGGAGNDELILDYGESAEAVTVTYTSADGTTSDGKTFTDIERITFDGSSGNDVVDISFANGSSSNSLEGKDGDDIIKGSNISGDFIYGQAGNDTLEGNGGNDWLYGGEGNDVLRGGEGNDRLFTGNGVDEVDGGAGNDELILDYGESAEAVTVTYTSADGTTSDGKTFTDIERITFDGSSGNDVVDISFANGSLSNSLEGKDGDDTIKGSNISGDFIYGQAGNDTLEGNGGNDWLYGGEGNDVLRGGEGNDRLEGNAGNNVLVGIDESSSTLGLGERDSIISGAGIDRIILGTANWIAYDDRNTTTSGTSDYATLTDFTNSEDIIQLQDSASNYRLEETNDDTWLYLLKAGDEPDELIAIIENASGLSLTGDGFEYVSVANEISFANSTYSTGESGNATITLTRTGNVSDEVSVTVTLQDGTAIAPDDFSASDIIATFAPGATTTAIAVPIVNDGLTEGNETLTLTLTNPLGSAIIGSQPTATLTLLDESPATLAFSRSNFIVSEDGNAFVEVTVVRSGRSDTTVGATVSLAAGTATVGDDYVGEAIAVSFAPTEISQTVTIPIVNDADAETGETILLSLQNLTGNAILGNQNTAILNIVDNDTVTPGFADVVLDYFDSGAGPTEGPYGFIDGSGPQPVSLDTVLGDDPGSNTSGISLPTGSYVTVGFLDETVIDGPGNDLFIRELGGAGDRANVFVSADLDNFVLIGVAEDDATSAFNLSSINFTEPVKAVKVEGLDNNGSFPGFDLVNVQVLNGGSTAGELAFESTEFRVSESGTSIAAVTVIRSNGSFGEVSATISLADGTAVLGEDYSQSEITVSLASGQTAATVEIPVSEDNIFEANETVGLTLSNPTGGATLGTQTTATLSIIENDRPGRLSFQSPQFSVNEDGSAIAAVTIMRSGGSDGEISTNLILSDGSAIANDYTNTPISLTFADGETSKTVQVPITDDTRAELTETIRLSLSEPTGGATLGFRPTAILNIVDNDSVPGVLSFAQADYVINEDGTAATEITVLRTGGSDGAVSARIELTDGSAIAGSDYLGVPILVSFADGETSQTVTVPIIDDPFEESSESLSLTLGAPTDGATIGSQNVATLTLTDNDFKPRLTLDISEFSLAEGAGDITATVSRNTDTSQALTVQLFSSDQTQLAVPATVTIQAGEAAATFTVSAVDDSLLENPTDFNVLASTSGLLSATDTLRVIDNDAIALTLTLDTDSVSEDAGIAATTATVTRDIVTSQALVVELASSDTSELQVPQQVVIAAGQASATFAIDVVDDAEVDDTQTVSITARPTDAVSGDPVDQGAVIASLDITDNESPSLVLTLNKGIVAESIGAGAATGTVTRNVITNQAVTVTLTSSDETEATAPQTVVIAANQATATFDIDTVDDGIDDGIQTVTFTANATGFNSGNSDIDVSDVDVPDLVITSFSADDPLLTGDQASFSYRVDNKGLTTAAGEWVDRVYLSSDETVDDGDTLLSETTLTAEIPIGQFYERGVPFFVPKTFGDYFLIAQVDAENAIAEIGTTAEQNTAILPITIAPAYSATVSASADVGVVGSPITLTGKATSNRDNAPIAFEFVAVDIERDGFVRSLNAFTDANGNFTTDFDPLPNEGGRYNINAYFPDNPGEDSAPEDSFTILGMQFGTEEANHKVIADTPFSTQVGLKNLTDIDLTGLTYSVEGAPSNWDVQVNQPTVLQGNGLNQISYTISAPNSSQITQDTFDIRLTSAEGVTAVLPVDVDLARIVPNLVSSEPTLRQSMLRGGQTAVEFTLTNEGGAATGDIQLQLPTVDWLSLASPQTVSSLEAGESADVTLLLTPNANLPLTTYTGSLFLDAPGNDADLSLPFDFRATSEATGSLEVCVVDELFYFTEEAPKLDDARVILRDYFTGEVVAETTTNESGEVSFSELIEGYYALEVRADKHETFRQTVQIGAGTTEKIDSFLSLQTVQYTWNVTPTEIEDRYNISVESVFETNVPAPVVVVDPPEIDFSSLDVIGEVMQIDMTFTNHGLIAANDVSLSFGDHPFYEIKPLIDSLGELGAKSSLKIPVQITRIADFDTISSQSGEFSAQSGGVPCGLGAGYIYSYVCGPGSVSKGGGIAINGVDGNTACGIGGGGAGGGGGTWIGAAGGSGNCDPCVAQNIKAAADCTIALIGCVPGPIGAAATILGCISGFIDGVDWQDWVGCTTGIGGVFYPPLCIPSVVLCLDDFCSDSNLSLSAGQFSNLATASGTIGAGIARIDVYRQRLQTVSDAYTAFFGDDVWLEGSSEEISRSWTNEFLKRTQGGNSFGATITNDERTELLSLTLPENITGDDVDKLIERWNRTVSYWESGIFNLSDVPIGQSQDFVAIDRLRQAQESLTQAIEDTKSEGYENIIEGAKDAVSEVSKALENGNNEGVCAKVRIRIDQDAVMTRSAFLGELEIENSLDNINLENVSVDLTVVDEQGNEVTGLFGVTDPILDGLNAVDGNGTIFANSTGSAEWTFIPTTLAAPDEPTEYTIGGTLSYQQDGQIVTVPLVSTPVTVYPQAELHLDYFQERNVYGDDPFTDEKETAVPFSLGVLVRNEGGGTAKNLSIESAQPKIIENEKGLLIDFEILGTQVGTESVQPTLTADFGDIAAGETAVADWLLKSSLQGKFIEYEATFEHVNDLGVEELSLIKEVNIHELVRKVRVDQPTDDQLPDFLVNDIFDANFYPDTLYFSDGTTASVSTVDEVTADAPPSFGDLEVQLTAITPDGWTYFNLDDPGNGQFQIEKILRSDGSELRSENYWTTDRTFAATGRPTYENTLHILDFNSDGSYTVIYDNGDTVAPQIREIIDVDPDPRNTTVSGIDVIFTEAILADTFNYQDLTLTLDGGDNLITDAVTIAQVDDNQFRINGLTDITGNIGSYTLSVDATGIQDLTRTQGVGSVTENWLFIGDRPTVQSIEGLTSALRNTPVDIIEVSFTEAIVPGSFDFSDILLTHDDGSDLITNAITITQLTDTSYSVGNLTGITDQEGEYELLITANGIQDTDGNNGIGGRGFNWTLDTSAPEAVEITDIEQSQRNRPVQIIDIVFDQAIDATTFDLSDIALTRESNSNLASNAISPSQVSENLIPETATISQLSDTTYRISGLETNQTENGTYTLSIDSAGITDEAGNIGVGAVSESWTIDTVAPTPVTEIALSPDRGISNTDLVTNTQSLTVTGNLPEEGLAVFLLDKTSQRSLGQATVTGSTFSHEINFTASGSRKLEIKVVDAAGNTNSTTFNLFLDLARPTIANLDIQARNTTEPLNFIDVEFSEIINLNTFDFNDITLNRDGGSNLITADVDISFLGGKTYRISGLDNLTQTAGTYELTVNAATLEDRAGNTGTEFSSAVFTITESPTPGITITQSGGTSVTEGGAADTYTLVLQTRPTDEVTVTLSTSDELNLAATTFTFTPDNWNTPQTVTVSAVDDAVAEAAQVVEITHAVSSTDTNYSDLLLPPVTVSLIDNDVEIRGTVWNDANGDRIQNTNETGLENWTVYLDKNNNGQLDDGETTRQTANNGSYEFTGLRPGTYNVAQVVQDGWQQTFPAITTTAASIEIFTPSAPEEITSSNTTTAAGELIALSDFRTDSRFTDITGDGYASVIIDTGIDLDHEFFGADADNNNIADRIVYQYDFADDDNDATDKNGHGSHVSSIIGSSDSTYGGIAPDADLIALKVFKDNGSGFFSDLEESLQWVINNATTYNVASVNLSLGDEKNWTASSGRYGIDDELAALSAMGIIVAAAAGNNFAEFNSRPGVAYPAADPNVISVGAVRSNTDQIADFSQRHPDLLDVFAPGIPITGADANGGTKSLGGTSQAAPYISGIAVLAQQIAVENLGRKLTTDEFDSLLTTTGIIINDGDDEVDAVINTGLNFPRVNMLALAEGILTLSSTSSGSNTVDPENNATRDPIYFPQDNDSIGHTVTLEAGEVINDLNFGNQSLPNLVSTSFDATEDHVLLGRTNLAFTIANQGEGTAAAFSVDIVYSDDETIGNDDDIIINSIDFDSLNPGESISHNAQAQLPLELLNSRAQLDDVTGLESGHVSKSYDYVGLVINSDSLTGDSDTASQGKGIDRDDITYFPWDIDDNGLVTPTDAIFAINRLGQTTDEGNLLADFDGNGLITPTDAIASINRLGYAINPNVFENNIL